MAGLTAAVRLAAAGVDVTVLDKGRAVGGRMATRRRSDAAYDHGAQHFSVRTPEFAAVVAALRRAGRVSTWYRSRSAEHPDREVEDRHVGVGGMRRVPEALASDLKIRVGVEVARIEAGTGVAALGDGSVIARADAAIVTPPLPQTLALLAGTQWAERGWIDRLHDVGYDAVLAVMARLREPPSLDEGHLSDGGDVAWVADNLHKGVSAEPAVTIHSSPSWAAQHLEEPPDRWVADLVASAQRLVALDVVDAAGHRWRDARPRTVFDVGAVRFDTPAPVVLAGEVFAGARVEGAFSSGVAAAGLVLEHV
jgi:predicted NAD/FAD-dependent oxidoreductase